MSEPLPIVTFGALAGIERAAFTLSRGVAPSRGVIDCAWVGQGVPDVADFEIVYNGKSVLLTDCALAGATIEGRQTLRVTIEDRRWRWRYSQIVGRYNVREGTETILAQESAYQLAEMIRTAIGEPDLDISAVSELAFPEVDWINQRGDLALAELLGPLGLDVAPDFDTGGFRVVRIGEGAALPANPLIETPPGLTGQRGTRATRLQVAGAPVRFQALFVCEAVGLDTDMAYKPIDELSYKPAGGWEADDPGVFQGVEGTFVDPSTGETMPKRTLAQSTVYNCYRVRRVLDGDNEGFKPDGFDELLGLLAEALEPDTIDALLPLLPALNDCYDDPETGERRYRRPYVLGTWYPGEIGEDEHQWTFDADGNATGRVPSGMFSIDLKRGVVTFSDKMFKVVADESDDRRPAPADVQLMAACEVDWHSLGHRRKIYYSRYRDRTGDGDENLVETIHRPDVILRVWRDKLQPAGYRDNLDEVDQELDYYLSQYIRTLEIGDGQMASYADLEVIAPDGAIEQVEWVRDAQGITTRVARNSQLATWTPSWKERQLAQRERAILARLVAAGFIDRDLGVVELPGVVL